MRIPLFLYKNPTPITRHLTKKAKIALVITFGIFLLFTGESIHFFKIKAHFSSVFHKEKYINYEEMTVEEKIGQLLLVHFHGETANEDAKTLIQKIYVGGFIYYPWANVLNSPEQVLHLSTSLQKLCKGNHPSIPLFIATDQEGGLVARLTHGFTIFPGNKALGMTHNEELAELCAFAIGQELYAVGINLNLSPVVDINTNPHNPVIGIRAFGESPEIVISFADKTIQGYQKAGIITSLKHFPGHGDVDVDSHSGLPIIKKTKQQLQKTELLPFMKLASQADTIMTAHVVIPSIDPIHCATLSKSILNILKNEIGFKGVIIADSLVMEGLLKNCSSIDDAAIRAINAGCDLLMLGGKQLIESQKNKELTVLDIKRIHQSLVNAVKQGVISEKRLNNAVYKILTLKKRYTLLLDEEKEKRLKFLVNTKQHNELAKKIASLALKTTKNKTLLFSPLHHYKIAVFAPKNIQNAISQTSLLQLGKENYSLFFKELNPNKEEFQKANEFSKKADILIFCSYNAWKSHSQTALIQTLSQSKKPLIIISSKDPLDDIFFPQADLILTTFSPTPPSIQAACEKLYEISSHP